MSSFFFLLLIFIITVKTCHQLDPQAVDEKLPKNCKDVKDRGHNVTDLYVIKPKFIPTPFLVLCDMETREGGWTYILSRYDGNQDFYLDWKNYKHGFGNLAGEFWLGLEKIHLLTGYQVNELLVQLIDWESKEAYAHYNSFGIGSEEEEYSLKVIEGYSGTAGDSLSYHRGKKFATRDRDISYSGRCARESNGAWWYRGRGCKQSQLTGKYLGNNVTEANYHQGISWSTLHEGKYSFAEARLMVRPRDHSSPVSLPFGNK